MLRFWKIHLPLSGPQPPPPPDGESDACLSHLPRLLLGCLDVILPTMPCYQVSGSTTSSSELCFHAELQKRKTKTTHYLISLFHLHRGAGKAGTAYASAFLPAHLVLLSWTLREEAVIFQQWPRSHSHPIGASRNLPFPVKRGNQGLLSLDPDRTLRPSRCRTQRRQCRVASKTRPKRWSRCHSSVFSVSGSLPLKPSCNVRRRPELYKKPRASALANCQECKWTRLHSISARPWNHPSRCQSGTEISTATAQMVGPYTKQTLPSF